ncbi:MAG: hypothetical protein WD690_13540 [Vicinamibacterales bacterium]
MTRFLAALTLSTAVLASVPVPLVAQAGRVPQPQQPPQAPAAAGPGYVDTTQNAQELRERFREVLGRYPRSVANVLSLDPTLFNDPGYLSSYPVLAQFVAQHPEIARNPGFYLSGYGASTNTYVRDPSQQVLDMMRNWVEMVMVFVIVAAISIAVLWLLKALIDHRRWLRVTKTQTEVHTKLLDRFSSSDELLAYMKTPAGARFLESAPIALDAGPGRSAVSAPINRILWSVQAGIVLLLAGLALFVGRNWTTFEEVRLMLAMMGTLGSFIGIGFIVSAGAAWVLSQRFGLMDGTRPAGPTSVPTSRIDSADA